VPGGSIHLSCQGDSIARRDGCNSVARRNGSELTGDSFAGRDGHKLLADSVAGRDGHKLLEVSSLL
jgi:hypothetical protein